MGSGEVREKFVKEWTSYKEGKRTIRETTRKKNKKKKFLELAKGFWRVNIISLALHKKLFYYFST